MTTKRFFSYDPLGEFLLWDSLEEARKDAQEAIDSYRDACDPLWDEAVGGVCYGEVRGYTVETMRRPPGTEDPTGCDLILDFGLKEHAENQKSGERAGSSKTVATEGVAGPGSKVGENQHAKGIRNDVR